MSFVRIPCTARRRSILGAVRLLLAAGLGVWTIAAADATEVRAWDDGRMGSLVLQWDGPVDHEITVSGQLVTVEFSEPVEASFRQAVRTLSSYIVGARVVGGGRTLALTLTRPMGVESSVIGQAIALDFHATDATAGADAAPSPQPPRRLSLPTAFQEPPADDRPATREPPETVIVASEAPGNGRATPEVAARGAPTVSPMPSEPTAAAPGSAPTIRVRGGEHPGYSRIVFDWTVPVTYRVDRQGDQVVIAFDSPGNANFNRVRPDYLSKIDAPTQLNQGGDLTVAVTVPPGTRLRHFFNGLNVVVDILDSGRGGPTADAARPAATAPAQPLPVVPPVVAEPPASTVAVAPASPATGGRQTDTGRTDVVSSADGAPPMVAAPPPSVEPVVPAETPAVRAPMPLGMARTQQPEPSPVVVPPEDVAARPAIEQPTIEQPTIEQPAIEPQTEIQPDAAPATRPENAVAIDPGMEASLAVFQRAGALWLVFAASRPLDGDALAVQASVAWGAATHVQADGGVAIRVDPAPGGNASAAVGRTGTAWWVAVGEGGSAAFAGPALSVASELDYALGPRVTVGVARAKGVVRLIDPAVGDVLIVAPSPEVVGGLDRPRRFAQFSLLPSDQGLVARPLADDIIVRVVDGGVEVMAESGLRLSSEVDIPAAHLRVVAADEDTSDRLFDIAAWRGPDASFSQLRQILQNRVTSAEDAQRDRARLDMARFYFAMGYAQEAMGMLEVIEQASPDLAVRPEVAALRGAARVLAGDAEGALEDFALPALAESAEVALWRAAAAAETEDWTLAESEFERGQSALPQFPNPFQKYLSLLAVTTALEQGDVTLAQDRLTALRLHTEGEIDREAATSYLSGRIAEVDGRTDAALDAYRKTIAMSDRLYRTLATMALVDLELVTGTISTDEAAETLETLRYSWRGDLLEFKLLRRLGQVYWEDASYRKAFDVWAMALDGFPDEPLAEPLDEMRRQLFAELLAGDAFNALDPIEAVSLFEDYADLAPDGQAGQRAARRLAERLVEIDLLGRAGDILEAQVRDHLTGAEKAEVGARLAAIRLLDGEPEAAIRGLGISQAEPLDESVDLERRLLMARALAEVDQTMAALDILTDERSRLADALRLDIAWDAEDWPAAADALKALTGTPPPDGQPIEADQASLVLNYGVALALADDRAGLDALDSQFGSAMRATEHAETFAVLTRADRVDPIADLASIRRQVAEVDLFADFLASYRDDGTEKAEALTN